MSFDYSYVLSNAVNRGILGLFNTMPMLLSLVGYILSSLGFYTLAQRRGIRHAWLSWIPVANIWILGSLSDQYRYVVKGQTRSRRKLLLTLKILSAVLGTVVFFMTLGAVGQAAVGIFHGIHESQMLDLVIGTLLRAGGVALLILPLAIVTAVFRYMALYDVYMSCEPENAVMFLILSIFFSFTEPFFVFFSREKEKGMPPRRQAPQQEPRQEPVCEGPRPEPEQTAGQEAPEEPQAPEQPGQQDRTTEYL